MYARSILSLTCKSCVMLHVIYTSSRWPSQQRSTFTPNVLLGPKSVKQNINNELFYMIICTLYLHRKNSSFDYSTGAPSKAPTTTVR